MKELEKGSSSQQKKHTRKDRLAKDQSDLERSKSETFIIRRVKTRSPINGNMIQTKTSDQKTR